MRLRRQTEGKTDMVLSEVAVFSTPWGGGCVVCQPAKMTKPSGQLGFENNEDIKKNLWRSSYGKQ